MGSNFVFTLQFPWSLYDPGNRARIEAGENAALDPQSALMIAAPEKIELRVRRGAARLVREGIPFSWRGERWRLFSLPAPLTHGDVDLILAGNSIRSFEAEIQHQGGFRKRKSIDEDSNAEQKDPAVIFVYNLVGLIELLQEKAQKENFLGSGRLSWDEVVRVWLDERRKAVEPHKALIVRHAEKYRRDLDDLVNRPRRVLERVRALQPIARVQELDRACIGWYVRQPGLTTAQKAGPRQRLLAVMRRESRDTLENRVLRDLLRRSVRSAQRYCAANAHFKNSYRYQLVRRYGKRCRHLTDQPSLADVKPLQEIPFPNYPLLFDARYHRIWCAWKEILHEERVADNAWRWQRRLWADIVRIFVLSALTKSATEDGGKAQVFASTPLVLRDEQIHGRFSHLTPMPLLVLLETGGRRYVVEAFDPAIFDETKVIAPPDMARMAGLGAILFLRIQPLESLEVGWIPIWSLHAPGITGFSLKEIASSASKAVARLVDQEMLGTQRTLKVHGLAIISSRESSGDYEIDTYARVMRFGLNQESFSNGLYILRSSLAESLQKRLFPRS